MRFSRSTLAALAVAALTGFGAGSSAEAAEGPSPADLAVQIRAHWAEAPNPGAAQTNADNYLSSLAPMVLTARLDGVTRPALLRTNLYRQPDPIAYYRVGEVQGGLGTALESAARSQPSSPAVAGVILDLRFADGSDFAAAFEAAGHFAARKVDGFRLGDRSFAIQPTEGTKTRPVMVLVNAETRGAAEALAAAVRASTTPCLLIGNATAGQAREYKAVSLPAGMNVSVAGSALILPDGSRFPAEGLKPDLAVAVTLGDERAYQTNEFNRVVNGQVYASAASLRLNEAELVRRRLSREADPEAGPHGTGSRGTRRPGRLRPEVIPAPEAPGVVQDPVLARALDLLSALTAQPAADGDSR